MSDGSSKVDYSGEKYPFKAFMRSFKNEEDNTKKNRMVWGEKLTKGFNRIKNNVAMKYPVFFEYQKDLSNDNDLQPFGTKIFVDDAIKFFNNMYEEEEFEKILDDEPFLETVFGKKEVLKLAKSKLFEQFSYIFYIFNYSNV